jgi:hypothetical protein
MDPGSFPGLSKEQKIKEEKMRNFYLKSRNRFNQQWVQRNSQKTAILQNFFKNFNFLMTNVDSITHKF